MTPVSHKKVIGMSDDPANDAMPTVPIGRDLFAAVAAVLAHVLQLDHERQFQKEERTP